MSSTKKQKTNDLAASVALITAGTAKYDAVIVCCTDDKQAEYWQTRLSETICKAPPSRGRQSTCFPIVLAVTEDWSAGGAGNGLGTLYAFKKAAALANDLYDEDLLGLLYKGSISTALFHTAGKGTRLAPLPAAENNNKPGVRLPANIAPGRPMTVLESVILQTGVYAPSRKGRLSVYWGDQIFIPSVDPLYTPANHVDIMCTLGSMVGEDEWKEKGLEKYGVIAVSKSGAAAQVDKVDHPTAVRMLASIGDVQMVGPSLGSFSVSAPFLDAIWQEFEAELEAKEGKMDTDPHFWMPMTLAAADYTKLMSQKNVDATVSSKHYARMAAFKDAFLAAQKSEGSKFGLFGAVDVGTDACWWDYGQLQKYFANNMQLTEDSESAGLLREFFGLSSRVVDSKLEGVTVDGASCVFSSKISSGAVASSVVSSVTAGCVQIDGALLINVTAKKITAGKGSIVYNVKDESEEGIVVGEREVVCGIWGVDGTCVVVKSSQDIDGGQAWKEIVKGNAKSFEGYHESNKDADVNAIEEAKVRAMAS